MMFRDFQALFRVMNVFDRWEEIKMESVLSTKRSCKKIETCRYIESHNGIINVDEGLNYWERICNQVPYFCELNMRKKI